MRGNVHDAALGGLGDDAYVALQRDGHAQPDGMAVDRGDHRLAYLPGVVPQGIRREIGVAGLGAEHRRAGGEVGTGAERPACAGDDHGSDPLVLITLL